MFPDMRSETMKKELSHLGPPPKRNYGHSSFGGCCTTFVQQFTSRRTRNKISHYVSGKKT